MPTCNPWELVAEANCQSCLNPVMTDSVAVSLLCQIAGGYTPPPSTESTRITDDGGDRITDDGSYRIVDV